MSEKQLLAKYLKERDALRAQKAKLEAREAALDGVITSLRVVLGESPAPKRGSTKATGTKALIIDVLATSGRRMSLAAIAEEVQVKPAAVAKHLRPLVESGDVQKHGKSRATVYGVA